VPRRKRGNTLERWEISVIKAMLERGDLVVEFVKSDTDEALEVNRILLKEVDKRRYIATEIVRLMHDEGFVRFTMGDHTELWRELDAKNPAKGFGRVGDYRNTWIWYESWVARVRAHCQEHPDKYKTLA
jgi:hypothetical protein